ncbi:MAG: hypothetical protein Q4B28_00530 [bacterium]|nr:hypothetical protein [bacterium]
MEEEKLTMLLAPENYYVNRKEPLHITLKTDNDREDHLIVHQDRMKKKSNTEANEGSSFEKILIDDQRVTTRTSPERRRNIRGTFDANPGFYYDQQNFPQEVENIKDVSQAIKGKEENIENTHQLCKNFTDRYRIEVQEIFGGNEQYPAFIELKLTDHSGNYKQLRF